MQFFRKNKTDQGWEQMQNLLRKEMPTKERPQRPVAFWWLALVLLPLCLGLGYWVGVNTATMPHHPERNLPENVLPQPEYTSSIALASTEDSELGERELGLYSKGLFSSILTLPLPPLTSFTGNRGSLTGSEPTTPYNTYNISMEGSKQSLGADESKSVTSDIALMTETPTVLASKIENLLTIPSNLKAVESEHKSIIEGIEPWTPLITPFTTPTSTFPKWKFGLSMFLSTERFSSLNGLGAGVLTEWNPLKRLGIRTGILYSLYKPTTMSQPIVKVYDWDYARATGFNSVIQQGTSPSSTNKDPYVFVPVKRLHRIEVPVSIHWRMVSKWKLITGACFAYTYSGQSADKNFADDKVLRLGAEDREEKVNQLLTDKLTPWQADFQTGISFNPTKRIELAVYYRRPFNSFINGAAIVGKSSTLEAHDVDGKLTGNYLHRQLLSLSSTLFF